MRGQVTLYGVYANQSCRYYRALGANIGNDCAIWAGGKVGLMTEPDLVELGDSVALDDCSVVAHINSRGKFQLNRLRLGKA